ncbi:MAG: hypothetical protein DA405_02560 [Bacteroidetes bacterium]|nr:MAG: hypothetical protein DA405_02560 [Bacteroidota bacterium]
MKAALFSITYWGPISYFAKMLQYDQLVLEAKESFSKQTYRNRTYVDGPNGALMLNLSVNHQSSRQIDLITLNQAENWAQKHWQALQTSYGSSPFFDAISADLEALYQKPYQRLWDLNLDTFKLVCKWLRIQPQLTYSEDWHELSTNCDDYRNYFHPKKNLEKNLPYYPQVFEHKGGFKENLSILDLICNEGPAAFDYLTQL